MEGFCCIYKKINILNVAFYGNWSGVRVKTGQG